MPGGEVQLVAYGEENIYNNTLVLFRSRSVRFTHIYMI
jgi:hypothetical protein